MTDATTSGNTPEYPMPSDDQLKEIASGGSGAPASPASASGPAGSSGGPAGRPPATNYLILIGFFAVILLVVMAMMQGKGTGGVEGDILRIARANDVKSLDPADIDDIESGQVCDLLYEGLVKFPDGDDALSKEVEPSLATSWEISADQTEYTFHLRSNVFFQSAEQLTVNAESVKLSLDRLVGLDNGEYAGNANFPYRSAYENIAAVEIVDPMTVKLKLKEPDATTLRNLAMAPAYIISPLAVRALKKDAAGKIADFKVVGTGPFMLHYPQDWVRGESLTITRFSHYWGEKAKPAKLVFRVVKDNEQRVHALQSGDVHLIADVPIEHVADLKQNAKVQMYEVPVPNVCYLAMNPNPTYSPAEGKQDPNPLSATWLREAIAMAIDKSVLAHTQYHDLALPARSIVPPNMLGYPQETLLNSPLDIERTPARLDEARRLVEARGHNKDNPVKIKLWGMSQSRAYIPDPPAVLREIKRQLADAWIDVELITIDWSRYKVDMQTGAYYFCVIGWNTDNGDPDNFLGVLFGLNQDGTPGPLNVARWVNTDFDAVLRDARRTSDLTERQRLYDKAAQMMSAARVNVPLVHTTTVWAGTTDVEGFRLHPMGRLMFEGAGLKSSKKKAAADNSPSAGNENENSGKP